MDEHKTFRDDKVRDLSKREYFASMAMQGLLANQEISNPDKYRDLEHWKICIAGRAVNIANELMIELNEIYD